MPRKELIMKKITRVRVTVRMAKVVRYIMNYGAKSAPEILKRTNGAFPSASSASVCLWSMAKMGILNRGKRINGNGETPFFLSKDMKRALSDVVVDDRRIMEIARMIKEMDGKKVSG